MEYSIKRFLWENLSHFDLQFVLFLLSLGHATSTAHETLKHNVVSRLLYFHFHFSSLKLWSALHLLQSQVLFNSSLSNSRIPSIYLFGYWEIPGYMFVKIWKKNKKIWAENGWTVEKFVASSDVENSILFFVFLDDRELFIGLD